MPTSLDLHKERVEVAVNIWGEILNGSVSTRKELVELLREAYETGRIEPIRGKTKIDIYDKELATVFLVGKYGLGLEEELEKVRDLFGIEYAAYTVLEKVMKGEDPRRATEEVFEKVDENMVFRVLRLAMTAVALGFMLEDEFLRVLLAFEKSFPEYAPNFLGFKRFYIAYKLAESIAKGEVRNRIEKEALKHAMCLRLGSEKAAPPDWFVREIAVKVLKVPEHRVNDALSLARRGAKRSRRETAE
uniref:DUF2192 domain-containing protein n=1 Tax=Thermofilum pendens TaxID=2269 RepID=A0A7C1P6Q5_THEPE